MYHTVLIPLRKTHNQKKKKKKQSKIKIMDPKFGSQTVIPKIVDKCKGEKVINLTDIAQLLIIISSISNEGGIKLHFILITKSQLIKLRIK